MGLNSRHWKHLAREVKNDLMNKIVFNKTELDENMAPIVGPTNGIESPHGLEINPGPIAMIYDDEKG